MKELNSGIKPNYGMSKVKSDSDYLTEGRNSEAARTRKSRSAHKPSNALLQVTVLFKSSEQWFHAFGQISDSVPSKYFFKIIFKKR